MFKIINGGKMPTRGTKYSACVDLYANENVVIGAGETKIIGLGVVIDLDMNKISPNFNSFIEEEQDRERDYFMKSHYLQLMLRSSLGKRGLILPNGVGVIDLDYNEEIKMVIHNPLKLKWWDEKNKDYLFPKVKSDTQYTIDKVDCIAQITLLEHQSYLFGIDTDVERTGGFGSTDAN